jgi:uncharacterized protein YqgV (UPF0045/DUF77 family)
MLATFSVLPVGVGESLSEHVARIMAGRKAAPRVLTSITIDDREGATGRLTGKIEDVERILGRTIKHG